MIETKTFASELAGGVATLTLDRPQRLNALTFEVYAELADAFEAIVAAVYLDGGFQAAWDLVERLLTERINAAEIKNFYDFKTRLQETSQARLKATPTYRVVQELGPDHDKRFVVAVTIGEDEWARAVGKSKKEAEQMAAADAHFRLEGSDLGIRPKRRG